MQELSKIAWMKRIKSMKKHGKDMLTICVAIAMGLSGWFNYDLSNKNLELTRQNQQLQNMLYNYTPLIFAYPKSPILVDLRKMDPNGELDLVVVIVTPHNGYAFVNQTFFKPYDDPDTRKFLWENSSSSVRMYRELIFAVPQGSLQTTLQIRFWCDVSLAFEYLQPGWGGSFPLGDVGLKITFHDVQANKMFSTSVTTYVRVNFQH